MAKKTIPQNDPASQTPQQKLQKCDERIASAEYTLTLLTNPGLILNQKNYIADLKAHRSWLTYLAADAGPDAPKDGER